MKILVRGTGLAVLTVLLMLAEGCAGVFGGGKRQTNADVTLLSFGSIHGELAPCG